MPLRQQGDGLGDAASKACRKDFSQPSIVRAEFGPETHVKAILKRHGAIPAPAREPIYTQTDYDVDLTKAIQKLKQAHAAYEQLPKKHREKFKTADELWHRYRTDNLRQDAETEQTPQDTPGEPPKPPVITT